MHDEEVYHEPAAFRPDRFMRDGALNPEVRDPSVAAFGFGRRICPGRYMAQDQLWIAVASVLAAFTVSKEKDSAGLEITPEIGCLPGFVRQEPV